MKNTTQSLRQSLTIRRSALASTGTLDWRGIQFTDFRNLGSQKKLAKLDVSDSSVVSFHTLQPQPILREIICDGSQLNSFAGLSSQPRLSSFSFMNTPLATTENSRLSAIICIGPRLSRVDGKPVTRRERQIAASFPPVARYLIENGWIVKFPMPSMHDFRFLADQFGINARPEDFISKCPPPEDLEEAPPQPSFEFSDDDVSADQPDITQKLASIIRPLGFAVQNGAEERRDIVRAVSMMCSTIEALEMQSSQL